MFSFWGCGMDRTILHCDCNGFFASVEMVRDPTLRGVPMAVCGDPDSRHGIILAKNELAKAAGVVTAETIWKAQRKCPALRLVPAHHREYTAYSKRVNAIYARYTDMVEPFGIDESWLDVTGSRRLFGTGREIADRLRREVREETGLTISVGVSFNKVFAKLGSDYKKPDATTEIPREAVERIVYPLPVETLLYVGNSVAATLHRMAIRTIGDLANADPLLLRRTFGKAGEMLYLYARGEEKEPVACIDDTREAKSAGNGMTFCHDLTTADEMHTAIRMLSDTVASRLRRHGQFCRTVQLTVKTPDLRSANRQVALPAPTAVAKEIADAAIALLHKWYPTLPAVRMFTVTAANLTDSEAGEQLDMFSEHDTAAHDRQVRLESAVDRIRGKYGGAAIGIGSLLQSDFVTEEDHASARKHKN